MPLALELAAARFSILSPEQVLDRLDQRFRFLVSDVAGRDHRHRNLVALLEWGYALLSPAERRLLAWLGVFVQGWTVDAVIDLAPAIGTSPEIAVDLLTGLANKSLASVDQSISPPRYRLLESVREFALEKLHAGSREGRTRRAPRLHGAPLRGSRTGHARSSDARTYRAPHARARQHRRGKKMRSQCAKAAASAGRRATAPPICCT